MAKKTPKGPASLFDKVKAVDEGFTDAIYSLSTDELNAKLVELARSQDEIDQAKAKELESREDGSLGLLREQMKVANETYSIPTKAIKLKTRLVIQTLTEKGK